jgi:DNA-binding CsgD family transcriptional regulator
VARICHELDGLPLALALAAARIDRISAAQIAEGLRRHGRLTDAGPDSTLPQHRSIRASLDWSHQLLEEEEQALQRRLAVFAGGWTLGAARAVAMPEASETHVRGLLDVLEANGLILARPSVGPPRWSFLQTVAEYEIEQLARDPDAEELRDRHLTWFREYAAQADSFLLDPRGHEQIDEEAPNLRLALQRALQRDATSALEIVASLTRHWILAEHFEEGGAACTAALSAASFDAGAAARATVHCGAGLIATLSEDYPAAVANTMQGVALMAELDDVEIEARCLQMSGNVLILAGLDLPEGLRSAHRAVELLRGTGDVLGLAYGLVTVAMAEGLCDRFDAVRAAYDEFLTITSASHHITLRTWAELAAAWAEVLVGSPERALRHANLAIALEGDWPSITHFVGISHRVHALARCGRAEDAVAEGLRALREAQQSGVGMATPAIEMALAVAQLARLDLDAADALARSLIELPQMHTVALMRETLGRVALARGDAREAATQARELGAVARRTGSPRHRALVDFIRGCAAVLDGDVDRGRDLLQDALASCWQLGLALGVAEALDELAILAAADGELARTARLAAAAAAARARLDCVPLTPVTERLEAVGAQFSDRDAAAAWDEAWGEGTALGLGEAVAYARRSRGPHTRSRDGWDSLTPTELQVAQLAATGLSNPLIASKLFMSRSTVKMHLSSVYLKLGVANRTELARISIRAEGA